MTTPAPPTGVTPDAKSARAIITGFLQQYGLGSLGTFAWNEYLHGAPIEQIMLDIRSTKEYQTRFPAMQALATQGRAISESQYIQLEDAYRQTLVEGGLPKGFYDSPQDFAQLITNDVSPSEFQSRVKMASQAAYSAPPEFRAEFERLFMPAGHQVTGPLTGIIGQALTNRNLRHGLPPPTRTTNLPYTPQQMQGMLTAYWLDPTKAEPLLVQQFQAAQSATAAHLAGYNELNQAQALRLAQLGVDQPTAQQGFTKLAGESALFGALPGSGEQNIGTDTQLAAMFAGDATAQQLLQRRAQERLAAFGGGGGYAASGTSGVTGLASANT